MDWMDRLERKLGRFAIPNIVKWILCGQVLAYAWVMLIDQNALNLLMLSMPHVLQGQVWRVITFLFMPLNFNILWFCIGCYFYYFLGQTLEYEWGSFKLNVYILLGVIGSVIASYFSMFSINYWLLESLFFAYAVLYPNRELLLMGILPVKVKWLGYLAAASWAYSVLTAPMFFKAQFIFPLLGFAVFFGKGLYQNIKAIIRREQWRRKNGGKWR